MHSPAFYWFLSISLIRGEHQVQIILAMSSSRFTQTDSLLGSVNVGDCRPVYGDTASVGPSGTIPNEGCFNLAFVVVGSRLILAQVNSSLTRLTINQL